MSLLDDVRLVEDPLYDENQDLKDEIVKILAEKRELEYQNATLAYIAKNAQSTEAALAKRLANIWEAMTADG